MKYSYHLVNVFAETHFGGNPLAVFPNANGLNDEQMLQIAKQFNLSETVFVFSPPELHDNDAVADLRIFTPQHELPLAGHPTLGSAFILSKLRDLPNKFILNTLSKHLQITVANNYVTLALSGIEHQTCTATTEELSKTVSLLSSEIDNQAFWLNTGSKQLFLKIRTKGSLLKARVNKELLQSICQKENQRVTICLWAEHDDTIFVRYFFAQNGAVLQDSGTGSACANLGAYFILQNQYPISKTIHQGDDIGRPNRLTLKVDSKQTIFVGGQVIEVGKGELYLPDAFDKE